MLLTPATRDTMHGFKCRKLNGIMNRANINLWHSNVRYSGTPLNGLPGTQVPNEQFVLITANIIIIPQGWPL